ncbi:MAG: putative quinol monooxygenase, partial [Flavobacteriales bacterium]
MEFEPENVSAFVNIFKTNKDKITTFDGCHSVELLRDINAQNIFFTYSIWDSE